jgi:hypothetical protein
MATENRAVNVLKAHVHRAENTSYAIYEDTDGTHYITYRCKQRDCAWFKWEPLGIPILFADEPGAMTAEFLRLR